MNGPLAIDLFCGLGGWTEGLLAEGYEVIGFDIEAHDYGNGKRYPAKLVIDDVLTLHGGQFKDASLIVASPPCQEFSYMAMPWSRAKTIAAEYRSGKRDIKKLTALFDACFRIQREAIEAAGHFIPMVVENVRGAQPWIGKARWNFGSYYLWGDVPALMPITQRSISQKLPVGNTTSTMWSERPIQRLGDAMKGHKNNGGSWFNIGSPGQKDVNRNPVHELTATGFKTQGMNWSDRSIKGQDFTRIAGEQAGISGPRDNGKGDGWFQNGAANHGSKSSSRKAASATIAKIPFPLAAWVARVYYPRPIKTCLTSPTAK